MPGSTFGSFFKISTYGESHGKSVGVIVDGVPPGIPISEVLIQKDLDRRKPGQSDITTPRQEQDIAHILSGVFEGKSTGTPLMIALYNKDTDPSAYHEIKHAFRPGHADYTYIKKYGFRDWRGSGRASGRETAGRVAAGAIARQILQQQNITIVGYTLAAGNIYCKHIDLTVIEQNPLRAADLEAATRMYEYGQKLKETHNSMGGIVECRINGVPPGIGEPVFDKLDALLAHAIMSIGAIKGFEIGSGFEASTLTGKTHNDEMNNKGFLSNNAGGILGGISTGEEIVFRAAVKPVSSISNPQQTIDENGEERELRTEGRHDVCICPRIVPVIEAMTAIVIVDLVKQQSALTS